MRQNNKIRFDAVSLVCAFVVTITAAVPLFSKKTDATLITLVVGAIGTGALLSNLIHDLKDRNDDT